MKLETIQKELNLFREEKRFRSLSTKERTYTNFSSNDYLGLANREDLRKEFYAMQTKNLPLSSSSSRLIDGSYEIVMQLENRLEQIYHRAALCYNSGFDANSSLIETLFSKESLILTDRLNHASIYDGILASRAKFLRYAHLDMEALERLLEKYHKVYEDIVIISETIYSMDGDCADLETLVRLKKQYGTQLFIDEAHSYGVHSYGLAYEKNLVEEIDYLVLPLGKAGASMGAYVLCQREVKDYLINKSRKFIYSTALPPINHAWNLFLCNKMPSFTKERTDLFEKQKLFYHLLKEENVSSSSTTHIVSILIGENEKASLLSQKLYQKGFLVQAIKEPTVPKGSARLRVSLSSDIPDSEIRRFVKELSYEKNLLF